MLYRFHSCPQLWSVEYQLVSEKLEYEDESREQELFLNENIMLNSQDEQGLKHQCSSSSSSQNPTPPSSPRMFMKCECSAAKFLQKRPTSCMETLPRKSTKKTGLDTTMSDQLSLLLDGSPDLSVDDQLTADNGNVSQAFGAQSCSSTDRECTEKCSNWLQSLTLNNCDRMKSRSQVQLHPLWRVLLAT